MTYLLKALQTFPILILVSCASGQNLSLPTRIQWWILHPLSENKDEAVWNLQGFEPGRDRPLPDCRDRMVCYVTDQNGYIIIKEYMSHLERQSGKP